MQLPLALYHQELGKICRAIEQDTILELEPRIIAGNIPPREARLFLKVATRSNGISLFFPKGDDNGSLLTKRINSLFHGNHPQSTTRAPTFYPVETPRQLKSVGLKSSPFLPTMNKWNLAKILYERRRLL